MTITTQARLVGVATERMLEPHRAGHSEEPFGPANGRNRTNLIGTGERRAHSRPSTVSPSRYTCRDHGRRPHVRTWPRLPVIPPRPERWG